MSSANRSNTKKSNLKGSSGVQKQGKGGNDFNRFHALSSPNFEDYEQCFPSLPRVSKAQIKEVRSAVKCCEPSGVTTSTVPVSDRVEEGRRLERLTVKALNRAKRGRSKLTQEEVDHLESWLARYRASNDQSVFAAPAAICDKRDNAQMPDKMALSESKEEQVSGVDKVKIEMEASTVEVESAVAVGEGCDKSTLLPNEVEVKSENVAEEESVDQGDESVGKGRISAEGTKSDSAEDSENLESGSESEEGDQGAVDDSGTGDRDATQGAREARRTVSEVDVDKVREEDEECVSSYGEEDSEIGDAPGDVNPADFNSEEGSFLKLDSIQVLCPRSTLSLLFVQRMLQ
ncbi:hypothetical protein U1Q18_022918 [Sarracenia purpurea var. burkii]